MSFLGQKCTGMIANRFQEETAAVGRLETFNCLTQLKVLKIGARVVKRGRVKKGPF